MDAARKKAGRPRTEVAQVVLTREIEVGHFDLSDDGQPIIPAIFETIANDGAEAGVYRFTVPSGNGSGSLAFRVAVDVEVRP